MASAGRCKIFRRQILSRPDHLVRAPGATAMRGRKEIMATVASDRLHFLAPERTGAEKLSLSRIWRTTSIGGFGRLCRGLMWSTTIRPTSTQSATTRCDCSALKPAAGTSRRWASLQGREPRSRLSGSGQSRATAIWIRPMPAMAEVHA